MIGFLVCLVVLYAQVAAHKQQTPKIAVIGGGVGGAAASYFLKEQLGQQSTIHLYEATPRLGGRVSSFRHQNVSHELGGTYIMTDNKHMVHLAASVQIPHKKLTMMGEFIADSILYDGDRVVLHTTRCEMLNLLKTLIRYLWYPITLSAHLARFFDKLLEVYELQDQGVSFQAPNEMMWRVGLLEHTKITYQQYYDTEIGTGRFAGRFSRELLRVPTRVSYNQDNADVHSFSGMVSALEGEVWQVEEGNQKLVEAVIQQYADEVYMEAKVAKITTHSPAGFKLQTTGYHTDVYDAVIIATPLETAQLELPISPGAESDVNGAVYPSPSRPYQQTVTTYVQGTLRSEYFHVTSDVQLNVYTTTNKLPFTSIQKYAMGADSAARDNQPTLFKLYSKHVLNDDELNRLFRDYRLITNVTWQAYPVFSPVLKPLTWQRFVVVPGMYYNNAIESAASAMEMSAIAAKNNAILVQQYLKRKVYSGSGGQGQEQASKVET